MAKKRQLDFAKTHLRPGRSVGRRRNITPTNFKAKKILLQKKIHKRKSEKTVSECLKNIKDSNNVAQRVENLNQLIKLIHEKSDSLHLYLSEILESVFKIILELDDNLRNAALQVVITILQATDDLQIHSFAPHLTNLLSCAMTHSSPRIKNSSLALFDCMLKNHPDLICHSVLDNLLHMVKVPPRKYSQTKVTSNLTTINETVYSTKYQINVLGHMNVLLNRILKNKTFIMDNDCDEQEVYWDCEGPLNLEIYAGGGLKPVDIEKAYSNSFDHQEAYFHHSGSIESCIFNIIETLPSIFSEEISSESKSDDNIHPRETIQNLNILFQVFCSVAEWVKLNPSGDVYLVIKKFLLEKIYLRKRFPFDAPGAFNSTGMLQFIPCVQLNLAICFLYAKFLVQPEADNESYNEDIFTYVRRILGRGEKLVSYDIKYESIPMLVKIMKIYFGMKDIPEVSEFLLNSLTQLCSLLRTNDDQPNTKLLISLFIKLSLDPAYHFLAETDAMKNWFCWLLRELKDRVDKMDKKLLGVIRKIASCKYPSFLQLLSTIDFSVIKSLLKHDDEYVRDTAIFLIYNMREINGNLLENISRVILLDPNFPKQSAVRLIRFLTYRFSEKPENEKVKRTSIYHEKGFVEFITFILNIAVDSYNLKNEKFLDFETNQYTQAVQVIEDGHAFNILPSLYWKEHSVLFEVCFKFLRRLPQEEIVTEVIMRMTIEILKNAPTLPIHCAIAILRLNNHEITDKYFWVLMYNLRFSCLLTVSVLTHMPIEDEWCKWNVLELMNSIELSRRTALQTIQLQEEVKSHNDTIKPIVVYYILRVYKFFLERRLIQPKDAERVLPSMEFLQDKCCEKSIKQQPLFRQLYNYFAYYL